jgi:hypothetical protein
MRLQAVARQVIDQLAGPTHAALGVEMELIALVRQDQLAPWLQASITAQLACGAQATCSPIGEVSIQLVNGLGVGEVDAALPASFAQCDRRKLRR